MIKLFIFTVEEHYSTTHCTVQTLEHWINQTHVVVIKCFSSLLQACRGNTCRKWAVHFWWTFIGSVITIFLSASLSPLHITPCGGRGAELIVQLSQSSVAILRAPCVGLSRDGTWHRWDWHTSTYRQFWFLNRLKDAYTYTLNDKKRQKKN